jgi:hypothetical protein
MFGCRAARAIVHPGSALLSSRRHTHSRTSDAPIKRACARTDAASGRSGDATAGGVDATRFTARDADADDRGGAAARGAARERRRTHHAPTAKSSTTFLLYLGYAAESEAARDERR